jgi:hypothetical protein
MSQEFVSVPREWLTQVSLMQMSHEELQDQAVEFLCEPCDEPAPPAGGEVEVLGHMIDDGTAKSYHKAFPHWAAGYELTELVDRAHLTRLQAENAALQQRLTISDQRVDDLESDIAAARELLKHGSSPTPAHCESVLDFLAGQSAPAAAPLDPVHGDVLPPIGSTVQIQLGDSGWFDHTVTGYYAWPNHGLDKNVHRVFVRVKDAAGTPNARLLADVRIPSLATPQ